MKEEVMIKKEEQLEDVTKVEVKEEREEVDCPRERVSSSESSNLPNPTHFLSPPSAHLHPSFQAAQYCQTQTLADLGCMEAETGELLDACQHYSVIHCLLH